MGVKLGRITLRKVGQVFIPVRKNAKEFVQVREIPIKGPGPELGNYFGVKVGKVQDFSIQRRGSLKNIGQVRTGFEKYDIGIKSPKEILPDFAKYGFMNFKNEGKFAKIATSGTVMPHLTIKAVKSVGLFDMFPLFRPKITEVRGFSKKAGALIRKQIKKGGKVVTTRARPEEGRIISGIDRKVNARGKGVRFVRIRGRIVPIRPKKGK